MAHGVMEYEPVIGLEVHVQLGTVTKLFCADSTAFGADPNTQVCPVCLGLPGALPVVNGRAVELGVRAALGLGCAVHETSIFARKNYFYPDLPKGYQISQFDRPLATGGWLDLPAAAGPGSGTEPNRTAAPPERGPAPAAAASRAAEAPAGPPGAGPRPGERRTERATRVRIRRVHLEEDAGKSLHDRIEGRTAIDLNRAGVPLAEIVTEPDIPSPACAREFMTRLKRLLEYLEVSDCDMEKGSLRVDANVSVRPVGSLELGTRTELKNMNSFANLERALLFEVDRQIGVLEAGGAVRHETLLWHERRDQALPMRSKEESHDYRYFPEPDLPPLVVAGAAIERARASLPELPAGREHRFREEYGLPAYDAEVLTATRAIADYFEATARAAGDAKAASNWVMTEVLAWLNQPERAGQLPMAPEALAELIGLVADQTLSNTMARRVFGRMAGTGRSAAAIVEAEGLAQVRDVDQLERWAAEVIAEHAPEATRYRAGEDRLLGFLMGRLMRRSEGAADPRRASAILREKLGR